LFKLAESLGQTVSWVMHNVSILELKGWVKYYEFQARQQKKAQQKGKRRTR